MIDHETDRKSMNELLPPVEVTSSRVLTTSASSYQIVHRPCLCFLACEQSSVIRLALEC